MQSARREKGAFMLSMVPRSTYAEVVWPALPEAAVSTLLAIQFQLDRSQWWSPEQLRRWQFIQLEKLVRHARKSVPFWTERLAAAGLDGDAPLTPEAWSALPPLSRKEINAAGAALHVREEDMPEGHGAISVKRTSGATGTPVAVPCSDLAINMSLAFSLRERLQQGLDITKRVAMVRDVTMSKWGLEAPYPDGRTFERWTDVMGLVFDTAPSDLLTITTPVGDQLEWLARKQPHYLASFPTNVRALARESVRRGFELPSIEAILTFGEVLTNEVRDLCREVWNARVFDSYAAEDVGQLAFECREHGSLHVQSESVMLEVLDATGRPCRPGEIGRVVVTPLHNFATPLLRYEIGDHAEVAPPCPCGRHLPALKRVLGRSRNMLRLPSGDELWPQIEIGQLIEIAPLRQVQIIQHALEDLEVRLIVRRQLGSEEEKKVADALRERLRWPARLRFSYPAEIRRSPTGKYEDFVCLIPEP